MLPRHYGDGIVPEFSRGLFFEDQRPVQVFAALSGEINPPLLQQGIDPVEHGLRRLQAAALADDVAEDLAGGAAHHEQAAFFQLRDFQQLFCRRPRLIFDGFIHDRDLLSD